jgi:hypothetical protein
MKRLALPSWLQLHPASAAGNGGAPAPAAGATPTPAPASEQSDGGEDGDGGEAGDESGMDLGISDALALLEVPAELQAKIEASEKAKPAAAEAAPAKPTKAAGGDTPPLQEPTWTAEQQAWFDARAKATTAEDIAKVDATAPEFSEEQRAWLEAQTEDGGRSATSPTLPEFTTPEQKAWADQQTAALAAAKKTADEATAKITELQAEVDKLQAAPAPIAGNVHPLALVDDAAQIDAHEEALEKFILWGKTNWDGTAEVPAANGQPGVRAYSAQEIREAVTKRELELRKVIPAARQALAQRQEQTQAARGIYPETFNPQTPEGQTTANLLRQYPILKVIFPNFHVVAGDAFRGEKLRLAEAAKTKTTKGKLPVPPRPGLKIPPKAGGGGGARPGQTTKAKDLTAEKFQTARTANGGDELAALTSLMLEN